MGKEKAKYSERFPQQIGLAQTPNHGAEETPGHGTHNKSA
jgi:hypothetical protein